MPRNILRAAIAIAVAIAVCAALAGCHLRVHSIACTGHGGVRYEIKGLSVCRDGYRVGGGCLLLHGDDRKAVRQCAWKP